jgi:hypothetical protein
MADAVVAGNLQDIPGADEIGIEIGLGIFKAVAHAGLGGEMDQDIRLEILDGLVDQRLVFQHADDRAEGRELCEPGIASFLEAQAVIGRHPIEA